MSRRPHVVIAGMMGAGKSTTADALSERLGMPSIDSDVDIERLTGRTGAEIAEVDGIDALHDVEVSVLLGSLSRGEPAVISAAGFTIEDERCRDALSRRATTFFIDVPLPELRRRIETGEHRRSMGDAELAALLDRRRPMFEALPAVFLDGTQATHELVDRIVEVADSSRTTGEAGSEPAVDDG